MNRLLRLFAVLALIVTAAACSKDSPTQPSTTTPPVTTPAPQPTLYNITGTVSSAGGGAIAGATVRVADGPNAGLTATSDGSGRYTLSGLTFAGFSVEVSAPGYVSTSRGGILQSGVTQSTANFTLLPSQLFTQRGTGDTVFTIPGYVTRLRVDASYTGSCQNFIVRANGSSFINIIIGTCSVADTRSPFSGTYIVPAGSTISIVSSTGINWTMTEVR